MGKSALKDFRGTMLLVVESWVKKEFGTVNDLAEELGKKKRSLDPYQTELRKLGKLPHSNLSRPQKKGAREVAPIVENPKEEDVIDVEVMQPDRLPGETFTEMKKRLRTNNNNTPAPNDNVRQHQLERINQRSDGGVLARADWFIPDHIEDREAHAAYQQIIGLLDDAGNLTSEWMLTRRIDDVLWNEIIGHAQSIIAFASCRKSDLSDAEPSSDDVDGIVIDVPAEGA